jgi:excisionase family DNA binding protein
MEVFAMIRTEQAAKILDVTKSTLESWRCRGGGPNFVRYGRAIRYREEDLERFIESKIQRNTSENPPGGCR